MRTTALSPSLRVAAAVAMLLGMLTAAAPPAAAHTALAASIPQPGAVVTQLGTVRLEFYDPLRSDGQHAIQLLGPEGGRWDDAQTRMVSDRALVVGVVPDLARHGEYTVRWCALTPDGHPQSGAYVFSYTGPTRPSTQAPTTADTSAACMAAATAGGSAFIGWLMIGVTAAFVLFLVTALLLSRRAGQRPR